ncbi:hypothetical protein B0H14DRAFT_2594729 [Mycena olivaceomarginata]|nr:hypothetical protein B0H14DRAFT_2594729 [Mycena olivaceomarginata]
MPTSPWLFQGPTERLCRALAADMNSVAPNWVQGTDLDLTLMGSKAGHVHLANLLRKHSTREDCLGGSLVFVCAAQFQKHTKRCHFVFQYRRASVSKFTPFPFVNPTWQLELIALLTARAEQTALTNDPAPSIERFAERARRCVVAYGGILMSYPRDHQRGWGSGHGVVEFHRRGDTAPRIRQHNQRQPGSPEDARIAEGAFARFT